jgi:hypothetical protein
VGTGTFHTSGFLMAEAFRVAIASAIAPVGNLFCDWGSQL